MQTLDFTTSIRQNQTKLGLWELRRLKVNWAKFRPKKQYTEKIQIAKKILQCVQSEHVQYLVYSVSMFSFVHPFQNLKYEQNSNQCSGQNQRSKGCTRNQHDLISNTKRFFLLPNLYTVGTSSFGAWLNLGSKKTKKSAWN